MPPNCPWTAPSRATIVSRLDELLAEPDARPVCALRVNFFRLGPPQQMASAAGSTGVNSSNLTSAKRILGKGLANRAQSPAPQQPFGVPLVGLFDFCRQQREAGA